MGDEVGGQLLGAVPGKFGKPLPKPAVLPRPGHPVADHEHAVPGGQVDGEAVGGGPLVGGQPRREGGPHDPPDGAPLAHIGGGGPQLEHHPVPGEQVHLEQVNGGEAPRLLPPEGQGGAEGDQGVLRVHPRLEELLQQAQGQGALPVGLGAGAHAVAQQDVQGAVGALEVGARVPAHRLPVLLPGGHPRHRHEGLLLDQGEGLGSLLLQTQGDPQQGGELHRLLPGGEAGAGGAGEF